MIKRVKKAILFGGIIFVFFLRAGFVSALEIHYPSVLGLSLNDTSTFADFVCYVFGLLTNLSIIIAVLVVAFGGVYYLLSYGKGQFTSEGKEWIKAGIFGLLIVVCASLIAYTINPALNTCNLGILSKINFNPFGSSTISSNATVKTYKEIPMGTLTENLLTKTMDCYGFDPEGNPIDGDQIATESGWFSNKEIYGPTYLNHDRADCIVQLAEGAQKKSHEIASLSDEITKLMNTCSCTDKTTGASKCDPVCDPAKGGCRVTACPGGSCAGSCVGGACKQPTGTTDCCPVGVKDRIEHGPICTPADTCEANPASINDNNAEKPFGYNNPIKYTTAGLINTQISKNTFLLTTACSFSIECPSGQYCRNGACAAGTACSDSMPCPYGQHCGSDRLCAAGIACSAFISCPSGYYCTSGLCTAECDCGNGTRSGRCCGTGSGGGNAGGAGGNGGGVGADAGGNAADNIGKCTEPDTGYDGLDEFRCPNPNNSSTPCSGIPGYVEKKISANNKTFIVIDQDKWGELNLIQQLTYFKEKIDEIKEKIQKDKDVLNQAKALLESPQCYLAVPYIDLLKTYELTDKKTYVVLTNKTFSEPETKKKIDVAKYCQAFNYNNSSCLKKCNDACPDTSPEAVQCYKDCGICALGDKQCQNKQKTCIQDCYNSRPCVSGPDPAQKFDGCMSSCQNDCSAVCANKYSSCSDEYRFCKSQCEDNGQCVLDNSDSCLLNPKGFQDCTSQTTDQGNTNYCINNSAYLCKNGSDQYAGYPDCVDTSALAKITQAAKQLVTGKSVDCSANYSSSFLFENPDCQKCKKPYDNIAPATSSQASSNKKNTSTSSSSECQALYPETAKCPTSSKCPTCKCDQIDETLKFSVPNVSNKANAGDERYITQEQPLLAHQMVGTQCNGYSYNDDPLTFYCQDNWWNDSDREGLSQIPMGKNYKVDLRQEGEIPIGQTIDDAKNWADKLIGSIDGSINPSYIKSGNNIDQNIQDIIDQMTKIGKAYETSPIQDYCKCGAKYEDAKPICKTGCQYSQWQVPVCSENGCWLAWQCACSLLPCSGTPCEQITDYLSELWNYIRVAKLDFIDFYTTMMTEPRSDIMKELAYSRQTVDACSTKNSAYGATVRLLNCTRVENELISPINTEQIKFSGKTINGYCYGKNLGILFNKPLTDNWFCAENVGEGSTTSSTGIYNMQK